MATTKTFTGADGTLFHIALNELGDALQWYRIAEANGLSDPMITGTVELVIPEADPTTTGGIPQQ
jgi:nucleoid-associated protein YgaU